MLLPKKSQISVPSMSDPADMVALPYGVCGVKFSRKSDMGSAEIGKTLDIFSKKWYNYTENDVLD